MRRRPSLRRRWARTWARAALGLATGAGMTALASCSASSSAPPAPAPGGSQRAPASTGVGGGHTAPTRTDWTVYHGTPSGAGAASASVSFTTPRHAWTSPVLDGQLYGEPLVVGSRVVVATEDDTVYALTARTGTVLWSSHLAAPVPTGLLPCGDIAPVVGITGTPVVDIARDEVFVVADELVGGTPSHHLVGLDLASGAVRLNVPVDPPGASPAALLQRTGLALDQGNVVFGFGGNYGDCGSYHGWLESVPEAGGTVRRYEVDSGPGERQGAIWMGGAAPEVDGSGNIWVAVGNGSVTTPSAPYDGSDSVLELSPMLAREQYFAPSDWRADNSGDRDLGSTAPALLGDGAILQVGKSQTAYLLSSTHLGGVGGELASGHVCTTDADGGDAVSGTTVYVGCRAGLEAVATGVAPPTVSVLWRVTGGATGPPVLAGGLVWSIGGGTLYGIAPLTGRTVQRLVVGGDANHFPTPGVGDGLLLAPGGASGDQVVAFSGSAGLPTASPATPSG